MDIIENIDNIRSNIPDNVKIIAVSKTKPIEDMQIVYNYGIKDFGENKVQELLKKYDCLPKDVRWHLLGHLQRNKVKYIVGKVDLIQSLDSIRLLDEIEKEFSKQGIIANALIQINIGRESQKYGILEEELETLLINIEKCSNVKIHGIMAIIPRNGETKNSFYFKRLYEIWNKLKLKQFKNISMDVLSMGMTHDYEDAIKEGSNMVRIGEGIFGKREYNL
ncbi:YggS family pyridoxal phosphate-dependent enzyme [Inconstantimicrobium mannanitabidum]|uniref:YggS family pyridoxal phosphate enzyme n=1 Tax=Inconstantimicrobium mannanitabidum TaxID=1604901 RepID=A0ACB5RAR5_9CLOT|nr:YggS family pyridoxal phosphate-dependent enzyme [Clostridium sp. TW13]GKX66125.1 YggS family pyridoxal phosphate enzyme [Clostridium sp. TW13]